MQRTKYSKSFKNKKDASEAGFKAGRNRTELAIRKIAKKQKDGTLTKADSKRWAKMMNGLYGMDYEPDFYWNKYQQNKGVKEMKTFKDVREAYRVVATTKQGETFKSGKYDTSKEADKMHWKMAKDNKYKSVKVVKENLDSMLASGFTGNDKKIIKQLLKGVKVTDETFEAAMSIGLSNNGRIEDQYITGDAKKGISALVKAGTVKKVGKMYTVA